MNSGLQFAAVTIEERAAMVATARQENLTILRIEVEKPSRRLSSGLIAMTRSYSGWLSEGDWFLGLLKIDQVISKESQTHERERKVFETEKKAGPR